MIDGWYCRSMMANEQALNEQEYSNLGMNSEDSDELNGCPSGFKDLPDYKTRYRSLKKRFKFLIYENEFLSDTLRTSQKKYLKVTRDRSYLLDRLLQYEKPNMSSSESNDDTESSEDEFPVPKKKKVENSHNSNNNTMASAVTMNSSVQSVRPTVGAAVNAPNTMKKKRVVLQQNNTASTSTTITGKGRPQPSMPMHQQQTVAGGGGSSSSGTNIMLSNIMTPEEVERHLQSKKPLMELVPERAPPTVPTEMFSNEPSLDSNLSVDINMMQNQ